MILLCLEIEKVFSLATDKWKRKEKNARQIHPLVSSHVWVLGYQVLFLQ
jgi:hypothetical protein